jgi:predicted GIY-YIG superfamily endonuclease
VAVYLIHFDKPYRHARHYVGYARLVTARLEHHRAGRGARLLAAVNAAGISYKIARTWPDGDRNFERQLKKNGKRGPLLCPICNPSAMRLGAHHAST